MVEHYSFVWIDHILLSHSPVDGHLGFPFLAIVNNVTTNIYIQDFVGTHVFIFGSDI